MEIIKINNKEANRIINDRKPLGSFYFKEKSKYIGIDNKKGFAWTEEFYTFSKCKRWLRNQ